MFTPDQYELLDFGQGRKLERFGAHVVDRPAPAAENFQPARSDLWNAAAARYDRSTGEQGRWSSLSPFAEPWTIAHERLRFELKRTDFGQVGLFPEQAENWDWLAGQVRSAIAAPRVLNLFGYTGASTLAVAAAGAEVTHVDAAANVVAWARRNAELSGLGAAPIRWIDEDAPTFVRRELKRGRQYQGIILDPPSYGHGPKGQVWKLEQHLPDLLRGCMALTGGRPQFILLTCHTAGFHSSDAAAMLADVIDLPVEGRELALTSSTGDSLPSGIMARWP
ncbi:MAG TPA: class I SAM-dependent methyltransferase [Pirellulales bacterium]|jgi:23S rRNA (cytosine1962-C5)-methyltransferase|nr:class I SAM-dependent methyltransferase [Pirellulales bacterium]